ncbi:MAG TPA: family 43 glycosylhydrolase [Actinopolymorphaceae bacterium]
MKIVTAALALATGLATGSAALGADSIRSPRGNAVDSGVENTAALVTDGTGEPCQVRSGEGRWPNPLHECPAADPGMVVRGDTWYAFTTGLRLYESSDQGRSWIDHGKFVETPPGHVDAWAPEVYRIGTRWICYFSMRPGPGEYAKLFVATSKNLERGWTLREEPLGEDPTVSMIDASMFQAPDGQRYLLYKEIGNRRIMIDRLSADGLTRGADHGLPDRGNGGTTSSTAALSTPPTATMPSVSPARTRRRRTSTRASCRTRSSPRTNTSPHRDTSSSRPCGSTAGRRRCSSITPTHASTRTASPWRRPGAPR